MSRQVVLDTETTGLSHQAGHRVIEIGCVELINRQVKGNFHVYLNPKRAVDEGAFRVHGISTAFLKDKPLFSDIVDSFLAFIDGSELIIHNATFDVGFLNAELGHLKWPKVISDYATVFDTLVHARQKHRGARNNLDALCKRYQINNQHRTQHGALVDAEILASVYLAMTGGQIELFAGPAEQKAETLSEAFTSPVLTSVSPVIKASMEEVIAHEAFMELLEERS